MNDTSEERYVRALRTALSDLPAEQREMVVADVHAHVEEATDAGASVESVLAGLGPAQDLAARTRSEVEGALPAIGRGVRATRIMVIGALVLGVGAALVVAFSAPLWATVDRSEAGAQPARVVIEQPFGVWIAFVALAPALLAAAALVVPRRAGRAVLFILAAVMTGLFALGSTIAGWYLPFIVQLWLCAIAPLAVSRGFDLTKARSWRIGGGLVIVVPAGGMLLRSVGAQDALWWLSLIVFVVTMLLAFVFVIGGRAANMLLCGVGLVLLVASTLPAGMLHIPIWWLGGLIFILGTTATASSWTAGTRGASS